MDLSRQQKIDHIIDDAHMHMKEIFEINENSSDDRVYQTLRIQKNDPASYLNAFIHYYMGVFEGMLISFFLEEFRAYPTLEEQKFISDSFDNRWKAFVDVVTIYARKRFRAEQISD